MDQTINTTTKINASLFTDDEGESTDTASSSEQEYRYSLRLLCNSNYLHMEATEIQLLVHESHNTMFLL